MEDILISVNGIEIQCAHTKHNKLHNFFLQRHGDDLGNVYIGKVSNMLSNISSAFVKINDHETGFLQFSKRHHTCIDDENDAIDTSNFSEQERWNVSMPPLAIKQKLLVQIEKGATEGKGPKLTHNVSIPGRFFVFIMDSKGHQTISKKITSKTSIQRLTKAIGSFKNPHQVTIICRTASQYATIEQLEDELNTFASIHQDILNKFNASDTPGCILKLNSFIRNLVFFAIDNGISRIIVDDEQASEQCKALVDKYSIKNKPAPEVIWFRESPSMFEFYKINNDVEGCFQSRTWLPSGGYLIIESTSSMHTIDVNSGRCIQSSSDISMANTILKTNLEAAQEIPKQIRSRNLGGIIICDFIDMQSKQHQKQVFDTCKTNMKLDPSTYLIVRMSDIGIVEITRKKHSLSLAQITCDTCPLCQGKGLIKNNETLFLHLIKILHKIAAKVPKNASLVLKSSVAFHNLVNQQTFSDILKCTLDKESIHINIESDTTNPIHQITLYYNGHHMVTIE